tara:strand:+ start:6017 stop:7528 length:1512 start_codon:yes stop_codon:yes gene_type:complete
MELYTTSETKRIDGLAIKERNITSFSLMEKAAKFSFQIIRNRWPEMKNMIIFCGKGNNAGDGYLLASLAKDSGIEVTIVCPEPTKKFSSAASQALSLAKSMRIKILGIKQFNKLKLSKKDTVIVDALIGIGIRGRLNGKMHSAVQNINALGKSYPIIALDVPSGICADTGKILGIAVKADLTLTFIGLKRGLYTSEGRSYAGEILLNQLDIKSSLRSKVKSNSYLLDSENSLNKLIDRDLNAHKGHYGHLMIIGGDRGFGGAAILASKCAAMSGCGLVSLATRPEHIGAALTSCPEVMAKGVNSGQDLDDFLGSPDVIVIGPGLGKSAWGEQMMQKAFIECKKRNLPLVMDADALNMLTSIKLKVMTPKKLVITPHPGEAALLLKKDVLKIEEDRFKSAEELTKKFNSITVLKGSGTIVCSNFNKLKLGVCESGNPGMASGGMGDILSGLIGSFIAQGLNLSEATETAVEIHSASADIASQDLGELGLLASDVIKTIRLNLAF